MKFGYDLYEVECLDIISLLQLLKNDHITVFQLHQISEMKYHFYLPIYQRHQAKKYHFSLLKSIGILHYILLLYRRLSLIGVTCFALTVLGCNQYIFKVQIIGNNPSTTNLVERVLRENNLGIGDRKRSYEQLNDIYDDLKSSFKGKIDYLNIYQEGSVLFIKYTNSVGAKPVEKSFANIYASKDGVIKEIDVSHGNIVVKLNQYVNKGDLLVSNTITATNQTTKMIETKGHIKAYTYQVLEAKIEKDKMDNGEAFSYLLYKVRSKLKSIDKIDGEKVLSYGIIGGKRVLKVQYVLIEDIAFKEEN